jgi:hypothetical protein
MTDKCDIPHSPLCDYYRRHGDSKCHYKESHNVECHLEKNATNEELKK